MSQRDITFLIWGLLAGWLLAHASEQSPAPGDVLHAAGSLVAAL